MGKKTSKNKPQDKQTKAILLSSAEWTREWIWFFVCLVPLVYATVRMPGMLSIDSFAYQATWRYWFLVLFTLLMFVFWIIAYQKLIVRKIKNWPILPIIAFSILMVISLLWSIRPISGVFGMYGFFQNGLIYYFCLLVFISLAATLKPKLSDITTLIGIYWIITLVLLFRKDAAGLGLVLMLIPVSFGLIKELFRKTKSIIIRGGLIVIISLISLLVYRNIAHPLQPYVPSPIPFGMYMNEMAEVPKTERWQVATELIKAKPWLGSGVGTIREAFYSNQSAVDKWHYVFAFQDARSDILNIGIQLGFLGIISYLWLACSVLKKLWVYKGWLLSFMGYIIYVNIWGSNDILTLLSVIIIGLVLAAIGASNEK